MLNNLFCKFNVNSVVNFRVNYYYFYIYIYMSNDIIEIALKQNEDSGDSSGEEEYFTVDDLEEDRNKAITDNLSKQFSDEIKINLYNSVLTAVNQIFKYYVEIDVNNASKSLAQSEFLNEYLFNTQTSNIIEKLPAPIQALLIAVLNVSNHSHILNDEDRINKGYIEKTSSDIIVDEQE